MITDGKKVSLYEFGRIIDAQDEFAADLEWEELGLTEDGWPRPGNCPVCGAPDWTCVTDAHYTYTAAEIAYVRQID